MTEQRPPLVPEDLDEREAERRRRQEFVRAERARLAVGGNLETREQRMARRAHEIRALMTREFQRLSYTDGELEIMPRLLAELLDLVDGMIAVAVYDERERAAKAATKAGIRYTERRTP
jgi:hypothetical protein